jgi:predicted GIY-YIG superfamily endonuclease
MYYAYILLSSKSHIFYYGYTSDLNNRLKLHNNGMVFSTKPHVPWKLVFRWYNPTKWQKTISKLVLTEF